MPGSLSHSPADIIRKMLVNLALGVEPSAAATAWTVHADGEADRPDDTITVRDTSGVQRGRTMPDGERQEFHGIQIRVRSAVRSEGYVKARAIAVALDEDVYDEAVTIGASTFNVHAISRMGDIMGLGHDTPKTKRSLFVFNALVMVRQK